MIDRTFCGGLEILCASPPAGTPLRRPLVFLHGAFAGAWVWAEGFLPWFARRGYPSYALSFRGHGGSDVAGDLHDLSVDDYRDDVRALLDRFGEAPVLIGHSMGGYVVQKIVEEVDLPAYVLMASVPPSGLMGPAATLAWSRPWLLARLLRLQWEGLPLGSPEALGEAILGNGLGHSSAAAYGARLQNESRRATLDLYWPAVTDVMRLRGTPALVLGAVRDRLIPALHVQETAAIVGTFPHFFADMGHAMMLETGWERVAERIHGFLDERADASAEPAFG